MKKSIFLSLFLSSSAIAQTVSLDNYFGIEGIEIVQGTTEINKTAITPTGEIISAGYTIPGNTGTYHLTLTRHHADGTIDNAFGSNGAIQHQINYSSMPSNMVLLNDGKIVVTGYVYLGPEPNGPGPTRAFIARLKPNGELDSTFATNGVHTLYQNDSDLSNIFVQNDGSIVFSGNSNTGAILLKMDSNGIPDSNFGINGIKELSDLNQFFYCQSTILLDDGNYILAGFDGQDFDNLNLSCIKVDANGDLVSSFADNGRFILDTYSGTPTVYESFSNIKQREDGKILLSGSSTQQLLLLMDENGNVDTDFGNNGIVLHNYPVSDVLLQEDDKILLGGNVVVDDYNYGISITRLTAAGVLDPAFNYSGTYQLDISEESDYLQSFQFMDENHLLIGGSSRLYNDNADFMLAKLDISETLSAEELSEIEFSIYPNPAQNQLFIEGTTPSTVRILNAIGQLVDELPYDESNGVSLANLSSGSYMITFEDENGITVSESFVRY